eukprot:6069630-Pyramimonas_sp.AAC.1
MAIIRDTHQHTQVVLSLSGRSILSAGYNAERNLLSRRLRRARHRANPAFPDAGDRIEYDDM